MRMWSSNLSPQSERATGMNGGEKRSSAQCCEKLSVSILLKADIENDGKGVKANDLGC